MARIEWVEQRLQRWAAAVTVGDGSGYPCTSVLHESWQPPTSGMIPSMKTAPASDVRATHAALEWLIEARPRLAATVMAVYVLRRPASSAAVLLECQPGTIAARVEDAHRVLAERLGNASGQPNPTAAPR